jgi:hypothetical protein
MNQPIQVPFRQNREGLCLPNKVHRDIHLRNCTTPSPSPSPATLPTRTPLERDPRARAPTHLKQSKDGLTHTWIGIPSYRA